LVWADLLPLWENVVLIEFPEGQMLEYPPESSPGAVLDLEQ
jgi:hypothetical protein